MRRKKERHNDDTLGRPDEVPAEEFTSVPVTGEFPEWRADQGEKPDLENDEEAA